MRRRKINHSVDKIDVVSVDKTAFAVYIQFILTVHSCLLCQLIRQYGILKAKYLRLSNLFLHFGSNKYLKPFINNLDIFFAATFDRDLQLLCFG